MKYIPLHGSVADYWEEINGQVFIIYKDGKRIQAERVDVAQLEKWVQNGNMMKESELEGLV